MHETELLTRREAASHLKLQPQTLASWATLARHLPYVKIGRVVRYRLCDLEDFMARHTINVEK